MSRIDIEPSDEHPIPYNLEDDVPATFIEALDVAANTVEMQETLGATLEVSPGDEAKIQTLLTTALKNKDASKLSSPPVAYAAAAFLRQYGSSVALDIAATRTALTNKLLELANCGEIKYELKALELLGKHSDIGLFTERSEITINHTSPDSLEAAIKERVKRLLNANTIDITPISNNLDEKLGFAD